MQRGVEAETIGRWFATLVFGFAGSTKAFHQPQFAALLQSHGSPLLLAGPAAWLISFLEIIAALSLWAPTTRRAAYALIAVMSAAFLAARLLIPSFSDGDCGCFVGLVQLPRPLHLGIDVLLLAFSSWFLRRGRISVTGGVN